MVHTGNEGQNYVRSGLRCAPRTRVEVLHDSVMKSRNDRYGEHESARNSHRVHHDGRWVYLGHQESGAGSGHGRQTWTLVWRNFQGEL